MFNPGRHRCVLFDVDGTIAETEGQAHLPAFNRAFEEAGLRWRWTREDYRRLLKTPAVSSGCCASRGSPARIPRRCVTC